MPRAGGVSGGHEPTTAWEDDEEKTTPGWAVEWLPSQPISSLNWAMLRTEVETGPTFYGPLRGEEP